MKKMKKLFAILMTMAMVMGLSITGFAAEEANITIKNLATTGTNKVTVYKILKPDVTVKETGYAIADGVTLTGIDTAEDFLGKDVDEQKQLIIDAENSDSLGETVVNERTVSGSTFQESVSAGTYAVFVENTAGEGEPSITYVNPMIVSVGYNKATYDKTTQSYTYDAVAGENSEVVAKYSDTPVIKSGQDEDNDGAVELGSTVTYTITTYIPNDVTTFTLTDTLTGGTYNRGTVEISIDGVATEILEDEMVSFGQDANTREIDFEDYLSYAGSKVTITYDVTVTGTLVNNIVVPGAGDHTFNTNENTVYLGTGSIKLKKTGEDQDSDGLDGAKFVIRRTSDNKYLNESADGLFSWVDEKEDANIYTTKTVGNEKGVIIIKGLDVDTYVFEEVEAPEGYSVNTSTESTAKITTADLTSKDVVEATPVRTTMGNTKLSSLPETGGMGTTLFTIAGCVIMISAAGLFFATRKKAN